MFTLLNGNCDSMSTLLLENWDKMKKKEMKDKVDANEEANGDEN